MNDDMPSEHEVEAALITELEYLRAEGFINVVYDENYPGDITHATIGMKTPEELAKDLENVMKNG